MLVAHLAVWGSLLISCLAQNHTCHRVQAIEETVAVPYQEPVTFRSYTWCLKVPPRCSKYTVVMRERVKYQIEVRNQTVAECCTGYVSLYGSCVAMCQECHNMRCDKARNCYCVPGYTGPYCNHTCEAGKWGERCSEACVCRVGEDCDPTSGRCSLSTTTLHPPTFQSKAHYVPITEIPRTTMSKTPLTTKMPQITQNTFTTTNSFIDLSQIEPTSSTDDLTDFSMILKQKLNDTLKLINNNNNENSLSALVDMDYPILPTESDDEEETLVILEPELEHKNFVVNSLNINSSVVTDRWISELGAHSGITLGSALGLIVLLIVTVSAVIRCRNSNKAVPQVIPPQAEKTSLHMVVRNSHYAVPDPPTFSFINGYLQESLARESEDDNYDHPCSVRCLIDNEPVYDELRY